MTLLTGCLIWRGNGVIPKRHGGGVRATLFLYFLIIMRSSVNYANMNLVGYFNRTLEMSIVSRLVVNINFTGATWMFSLIGGFVSDTLVKRFTAILLFGPLEILGCALLAIQAHFPSLQPQKCKRNQVMPDCTVTHGRDIAWLYICLFMIALGEGFMRACTPSFGGDQFDSDDPLETMQKSRFRELVSVVNCCGGLFGLVLIVWIEDYKGWDFGFGTCAAVVLAGLIVVASGFAIYRIEENKGSPLTRILQVIVAALKKREIVMPENLEEPELSFGTGIEPIDAQTLPHKKYLMFLNKASIYTGEASPWSYCTITEVEETKSFLKLMPILFSCIMCYAPLTIILTLTVQVGATMNTKVGSIHISSASLFVIPLLIQLIFQIIYNHIVIPIIQNCYGNTSTYTTNMVRVSIGFGSVMLAACVAAVVEKRRRLVYKRDEVMSVLWLLPQFIFVSLTEVTSSFGLMDFFQTELPEKIKSVHASMVFCVQGFGTWIGGLIILIVNRATRDGDKREGNKRGWLDGKAFNEMRLDYFYLLISILQLLSLLNFMYWFRRYTHTHRRSSPRN